MIFIGTAQLIRQTSLQTSLFKDWITQSQWRNFWGSGEHFDWWAFPIDVSSDRHGDRYNVAPAIAELRNDPEFLHAVLENAQLFAFGLGYDLVTGRVIDPTRADHYAVRLYKCGRALHLWGMPEAHRAFVGCVDYLLEGHPELAKTLAGIRADKTPELNPLVIDLVVVPENQHPRETI
jgi:hypothetical protein